MSIPTLPDLPGAVTVCWRNAEGLYGQTSAHPDMVAEHLPPDIEVIERETFDTYVASLEADAQALRDQAEAAADAAQAEREAAAAANREAKIAAGHRLMKPPVKMTAAEAAAVVGLTPEDLA